MKHLLLSIFISIAWNGIYANDGAYYTSGTQLIPINETTIEVQKEILKITKVDHGWVEVDVYYEFYNPGKSKTITVGFEASRPYGDADYTATNGEHPNIDSFITVLNGKSLPYQVAFVLEEDIKKAASLRVQNFNDFDENMDTDHEAFYYVYYFEAKFKEGKNIIKHSYKYNVSTRAGSRYLYSYVLTAANRWANHQIDDFTLIIDHEDFDEFAIGKNFFESPDEWKIQGKGIVTKGNSDQWIDVYLREGELVFQKKNFQPKGELEVESVESYYDEEKTLPYYPNHPFLYEWDFSKYSDKILRNLPFARRGYVFSDQELQEFYSKQAWYIPDPSYTPKLDELSRYELEWYSKYLRLAGCSISEVIQKLKSKKARQSFIDKAIARYKFSGYKDGGKHYYDSFTENLEGFVNNFSAGKIIKDEYGDEYIYTYDSWTETQSDGTKEDLSCVFILRELDSCYFHFDDICDVGFTDAQTTFAFYFINNEFHFAFVEGY